MLEEGQTYDYAVIGGGVHGLSTAYHLCKTKARVALFEQFTIGHTFGSSHGPNRITRSVYPDKFYADLAQLCNKEYWPEMQSTLNCKFLYPNPYVHLEKPSKQTQKLKELCKTYEGKIIQRPVEQLKKQIPTIPNATSEYEGFLETKAGVLSAANYISRLYEYLKSQPNVVIYENTVVKDVRGDDKRVYISTESENLKALKVVLTCGKWISEMVPDFKQLVTPVQQLLIYLEMENQNEYRLGKCPAFYVKDDTDKYFGLPDIQGKQLKVGTHFMQSQTPEKSEQKLPKFIKQFFKNRVKKVIRTETCYYTITKTEETFLQISPVIGKIVADLLLKNKRIGLFEKSRHTFKIPYHQGINLKP